MADSDGNAIQLPQDLARVMRVLQHGQMHEAHAPGALRWSSNSTFLVAVRGDDCDLPAVYKPRRGERPLWDFPDGTLCLREYAAFLVSEKLDWQIVPPTVLREGLRGFGSVQFYVLHNPEINYFTLDEGFREHLLKVAAFDYVINNADRKGGHCLVDTIGHLWGIDHGIAFHTAPKLRTVIWDFAGEPMPNALLMDLERLYCELETPAQPFRQQMAQVLSEPEIAAFLARLRKIIQRREYPRPGPGPNYPWPPV